MRLSAAQALPSPTQLREQVQKLAWAIAADGTPIDEPLLLLPHAARVPRGEAYISWAPSIAVAPGTEVTWSITEGGQAVSGSAVVGDGSADGDWPDADLPRLRERAVAPIAALWEIVPLFERLVTDCLRRANRFVARELEDRLGDEVESLDSVNDNNGTVDDTALHGLITELLYGADGAADSVVMRMARRAATTPINNQPLGSWFVVNLQARAETAVRRAIGDPHIGRKVRRLLRERRPESLDELVAMYQLAHPRDKAGRERIVASLSAGKLIDTSAVSMDGVMRFGESQFVDSPVARELVRAGQLHLEADAHRLVESDDA